MAGGKYFVCWESAIKYLFHFLELFFFGCFSKPSILMIPKLCAGEPNPNVIKKVGELFTFHVIFCQLVNIGKVIILKELVNVVCSGSMYL